jgi:hypothetical protein
VLFGSILLYSAANVANAFVTDVYLYRSLEVYRRKWDLRGKVGAAITLVAEILPKEKRGLGTMLVGGIGLSGSEVAAFTSGDILFVADVLLVRWPIGPVTFVTPTQASRPRALFDS